EGRTKPYLAKIIANNDCRLDREAQATLAAWCFKTACVADQVTRQATVPREYVESFYCTGELPAGVFVHLGRRRRLRPVIPVVPLAEGDDPLAEPLAKLRAASTVFEPLHLGIGKTVIVVGEMVAQVLAFSQPNVKGSETAAADAVRIWPVATAVLDWPMDFTDVAVE